MNTIILYIFLSILPIYTLILLRVNNWVIPHSISDTYYILQRIWNPYKHLFTITLFGISVIPLMLIVDYGFSPFMLLSSMGLLWVGTMTEFKKDHIERWIHYVGAGLGLGVILLELVITKGMWISLIGFLVMTMQVLFSKSIAQKIFWIEVIGYAWILLGLLLSI